MSGSKMFYDVFCRFLVVYIVVGFLSWSVGEYVFQYVFDENGLIFNWLVPGAIHDDGVYTSYVINAFVAVINVVFLCRSRLGFHLERWLEDRPLWLLASVNLVMYLGVYYGAPLLSEMPGCNCYLDDQMWYLVFLTIGFSWGANMAGLFVKKMFLLLSK